MENPDSLRNRLHDEEQKNEEQQHLNFQLQHDYDELSKKLAAAELTIDRLRLGVSTRVHKTVVYELKEKQPAGRYSPEDANGFMPAADQTRQAYREEIGQYGRVEDNAFLSGRPLPPRSVADVEEQALFSEPSRSASASHNRDVSIADTATSSISQSLFSPGRAGSMDSRHLALILLCQSLREDIDALLRRLEQAPPQERRRDNPDIQAEFSGLRQRFSGLEEDAEQLREARSRQGTPVSASQRLENDLVVLRGMMTALEDMLCPQQFALPVARANSSQDEAATPWTGSRHTTPSPDDSFADIPPIGEGEFEDLSQYGRPLPQDTPVHSPSSPPQDSTLLPSHVHSDSSPLSVSSPEVEPSTAKHTLTGSRLAWQSSESEESSVRSRSNRRLPTTNAMTGSSSMPTADFHAPPATTSSATRTEMTGTAHVRPAAAVAQPHSSAPGMHHLATSYPAASEAEFMPIEVAPVMPTFEAVLSPSPVMTPTPPMTDPRYALGNGAADERRPPAKADTNIAASTDGHGQRNGAPTNHHPTAYRMPSVGERDSGYTGSDRQVVVERGRLPNGHTSALRSSTGSELQPIASRSSASTSSTSSSHSDQLLNSASPHTIARDSVPAEPASRHMAPHGADHRHFSSTGLSTSSSERSRSGGESSSSLRPTPSPGANSALINLRADLARLRQQLLEPSPTQPQTMSHRQPVSTPARPALSPKVPRSLCSSPAASEAALRNLLDNATGGKRPPVSPVSHRHDAEATQTPLRHAAGRRSHRSSTTSLDPGRTMPRRQLNVQPNGYANVLLSSTSSLSSSSSGSSLPRPAPYREAAVLVSDVPASLSSTSGVSNHSARPLLHTADDGAGRQPHVAEIGPGRQPPYVTEDGPGRRPLYVAENGTGRQPSRVAVAENGPGRPRQSLAHYAPAHTQEGGTVPLSTQTPLRERLPRHYDTNSPISRQWQPGAISTPLVSDQRDAFTQTPLVMDRDPVPEQHGDDTQARYLSDYQLPPLAVAAAAAVSRHAQSRQSPRQRHSQAGPTTIAASGPAGKSVSWQAAPHGHSNGSAHGYADRIDHEHYAPRYSPYESTVRYSTSAGGGRSAAAVQTEPPVYSASPGPLYVESPRQWHVPAGADTVPVERHHHHQQQQQQQSIYSPVPVYPLYDADGVARRSVSTQGTYVPASPSQAYSSSYYDELDLTEANREAARLKTRALRTQRELEDSVSFHSFVG